jgi:hypothetical protein
VRLAIIWHIEVDRLSLSHPTPYINWFAYHLLIQARVRRAARVLDIVRSLKLEISLANLRDQADQSRVAQLETN